MKEFIKSFMIGLFLVPFCLSSQDIILPNDLPSDYVFSLDSEDVPMLITKNKAIRLKTQWAYDNLETDSLRLGQEFFKALSKFNNETLIVLNNSDGVLLALDGGGHILSLNKSILSRIDNSVNQKNRPLGERHPYIYKVVDGSFYVNHHLYLHLIFRYHLDTLRIVQSKYKYTRTYPV